MESCGPRGHDNARAGAGKLGGGEGVVLSDGVGRPAHKQQARHGVWPTWHVALARVFWLDATHDPP